MPKEYKICHLITVIGLGVFVIVSIVVLCVFYNGPQQTTEKSPGELSAGELDPRAFGKKKQETKLGKFQKAAVSVDAGACADIAM